MPDISDIIQIDGNFSFNDLTENCENTIPVYISNNRPEKVKVHRTQNKKNLVTIKRNNKLIEAANLPTIVMLNPRSLYNKKNEFSTLIEQTEAGLCFVSETWDRSHQTNGLKLPDLIDIEGYKWIQNIVQRRRRGGKPAILVSERDFNCVELCPDTVTVPLNVEIVWALLTPKRKLMNTRISRIVVASLYYSSTLTKKSELIDHISETYHFLCAKFGSDTKFIIGGDVNRLNISSILTLSPDLKQVVNCPTRRNPDATLDVIISNLSSLYHPPRSLPPLENDCDKNGQPSDHLIVLMEPLSINAPALKRKFKKVQYRPFPDSAIRKMGEWLQSKSWTELYRTKGPNQKAEMFEQTIMEKVDLFFPFKTMKIDENDKPWVDKKLQKLDRMRKREFNKRKKSDKWTRLNQEFLDRVQMLKDAYYKNVVEDLKTSDVSKWYSKVKRMSQVNSKETDNVQIQNVMHLPSSTQAELIADKYAQISNEYAPLKMEDIEIPNIIDSKPYPLFEPFEIHKRISKIKNKKSSILGDIPWRVIKEFSVELAEPLAHIYNTCTIEGIWPNIWKHELVTPVPKTHPPQDIDDMRKIAGTKNLSKVYESLLSDSIIGDINAQIDPSQYGNEKGLSTTHYLVNMIHKILMTVDTNNSNEKYAVIAQLVDWSKAFDRQDPKIGMDSFIKCGVRPSLIPILGSFFQERKMTVKWLGTLSTTRNLPGGVPQGCLLGNLQYKVNSNDNASHVKPDQKYKFVDDLSILELLNLMAVGVSSYNFKSHVASDIGIDQLFIPSNNILSQKSLDTIHQWTEDNLQKMNPKKTSTMVFNFTDDYQFATRLYLENSLLETVTETKLLGTLITSDLKWDKNTHMICSKAYKRMIILQKLSKFNPPTEDMLTVFKLYIRSILEQNCQLWHYSITQEDIESLERVQKVACKIILGIKYVSYEDALVSLNIQSLYERRQNLSLKFAKRCIKHPRLVEMFPENPNSNYTLRKPEKYVVHPSRTSRLLNSTIPQLQRALNREALASKT